MRTDVLDHGYVEFVEAWGKGSETVLPGHADYERGIIEAARQSTQGSFRGWDKDAKLLKHLYENGHATPFEFSGMVIEVQAPIFVFREWHRHRTQSYNEMSARYAPLPPSYYLPTFERCMLGNVATTNKQAQSASGIQLSEVNLKVWLNNVINLYNLAEAVYQEGLYIGVPKELARIVMPVGHYTRMRCSCNLRNWIAFLTLRMDPNAQYEIRQFAHAVAVLLEQNFPQTWKLFVEDMQ